MSDYFGEIKCSYRCCAHTATAGTPTLVAYATTYDPAHRVNTVSDSRGGKTLTYTWSPGGRLARIVDSDGNSQSYAYDGVGRLASQIAPNGETITSTWDAGGRLIERRLGSGLTTTQTWHADGTLKTRTHQSGAGTLSSHTYSLDAQGRRASHTESIGGSSKAWTTTYDQLDRLLSANDGSATETSAYDIWGNRTRRTTPAQDAFTLYDAAHRLTEIRSGSVAGPLHGAAVHDADGHLTKLCEAGAGGSVTLAANDCVASGPAARTLNLAWNALDQLQSAARSGSGGVTETYAYDHAGRRIRKVTDALTTSYGNDFSVSAVPEPAVSGLIAAGTALLAALGVRRRKPGRR